MDPINRSEARARGLARYFTGKQCARGHVAERYVSKANCVECTAATTAQWCQAHRDRKQASDRAASLRWYRRNHARALVKARHRQIAKEHRTPAWADHARIRAIYETAAQMPGVHVDHIIPLRGEHVSGLHVHENLQIISAAENLRKRNCFAEVA